jgi:hypothetical protein
VSDPEQTNSGYHVIESYVRVGHGEARGAGMSSLPPEHRRRFDQLRTWGRLRDQFAAGELRRIVGVGQSVTRSEITVELLAIEIRAAASRAIFRWHAGRPLAAEPRLIFADIGATDDRATRYVVHAGPFGNPHGGEGEGLLEPSPLDDARELRVAIERFAVMPQPTRPGDLANLPMTIVEGPWEFRVRL